MIKKLAISCLIACFLPVQITLAASNYGDTKHAAGEYVQHDHASHEKTDHVQASSKPMSQAIKSTTEAEKPLLPVFSARFELQSGVQSVDTNKTGDAAKNTDWLMDRKANNIATFNTASQQGEIWSRDQQGDISHSRLFVQDKKIIEYTNGELKTLNKVPNWQRLATIFDTKQIAKLNKTGEKGVLGQQAQLLEGKINGQQTVVWWLPSLQIPAYIQQGEGSAQTRMVLKELYQTTPTHWDWVNTALLSTYSTIDASDLGDMESDPFVKKIQNAEGHHHH